MAPPYGPRIRAARGYADLTQDQLADKLGVDKQTVLRRESSTGKNPKRGDLLAIAAACDVPVEFLEHGFAAGLSSDAQRQLDTFSARLDAVISLLLTLVPDEDAARARLEQELAAGGQPADTLSIASAQNSHASPNQ